MGEIKFYLDKPSRVKIRVCNQHGCVLDILEYFELPSGKHDIRWSPKTSTQSNAFAYVLEVGGKVTQSAILNMKK